MTRQNTEKKRTLSRLLVVLAALALLSFCFLGTTFGRYTTGATGSGSVGVALWDIDWQNNSAAEGTTISVSLAELSPSMMAYGSEEGQSTNRSKTTGYIYVGSLINNSQVAANVTLASAALAADNFTFNGNAAFDATGYSWDTTDSMVDGDGASEAQVLALFNSGISLYYTTGTAADGDTSGTMTKYTGTAVPLAAANAGDNVLNLFITITWDTYDDAESAGALGDAIDTWVGENVASFTFTLGYTAVQNSELPG